MIHLLFDIIALVSSVIIGWWFRKRYQLTYPSGIKDTDQYYYYLVFLFLGMVGGSVFFGTLNTYLSSGFILSKSMLGGIFGSVVAAEGFKYFSGIRVSTGLYFVPSLCVLIIVGRIGCFLSGLPDFTYGVETHLPWGVDFGDGIRRHPVQIYEMVVMSVFLLGFLVSYPRNPPFWQVQGFYLFMLVYASQRFIWEFIKPYAVLGWGLNLFQWLCLGLIAYSLIMINKRKNNVE